MCTKTKTHWKSNSLDLKVRYNLLSTSREIIYRIGIAVFNVIVESCSFVFVVVNADAKKDIYLCKMVHCHYKFTAPMPKRNIYLSKKWCMISINALMWWMFFLWSAWSACSACALCFCWVCACKKGRPSQLIEVIIKYFCTKNSMMWSMMTLLQIYS